MNRTLRARNPSKTVLALAAYVLVHVSYLFSGCQYTIEGNPDIDLTEVHVSPIYAAVELGAPVELRATVLGFSQTSSVTWSIEGTGNGSITSNGLTAIYTPPPSPSILPEVIYVKATSNEDANRSSTCAISIMGGVGMFAATPDSVTLLTNSLEQLTIDSETIPPPLRWEIVSGSGSITDSGLYTAPATIPMDSVQTIVRAVSIANDSVYSESIITLLNASDSQLCFTRDIEPIVSANCGGGGCHDATTHAGGYNFNTLEGTIHSVEPGNAHASRIFTAITQFNVNDRMPPPPAPALSPAQVLKIGEWIDEGANDCQ